MVFVDANKSKVYLGSNSPFFVGKSFLPSISLSHLSPGFASWLAMISLDRNEQQHLILPIRSYHGEGEHAPSKYYDSISRPVKQDHDGQDDDDGENKAGISILIMVTWYLTRYNRQLTIITAATVVECNVIVVLLT